MKRIISLITVFAVILGMGIMVQGTYLGQAGTDKVYAKAKPKESCNIEMISAKYYKSKKKTIVTYKL